MTHHIEIHPTHYRPGCMALVWRAGKVVQALFRADFEAAWLAATEWIELYGKGEKAK